MCSKWSFTWHEQRIFSSTGTNTVGSFSEVSDNLSAMLTAAPPKQQKQILGVGEHLYPLVSQHKPNLAAKVTGMLLEMDNSELLSLFKSPESLAAMVQKAVEALKLSKTEVPSQDSRLPNSLSAEVTVKTSNAYAITLSSVGNRASKC